MGVDPARLSTDTPQVNFSLGFAQAELLRQVNLALGDRLPHARAGYGRVGKRYLARQILAPQGGAPPRLPAEVSEWCAQRSEDTVKELAERGYDIVGDLADLMPADPPEPGSVDVGDADLVASASAALADIVLRRHLEQDELRVLRRQVRRQHQQLDRQSVRVAALESRSLLQVVAGRAEKPARPSPGASAVARADPDP